MEEEQTRALHCANDKGRAHAIVSEGKPTIVECPVCKKTDTLEDATVGAVKAQFQAMMSRAASGSGGLTFTKSSDAPRWVFGEPAPSSGSNS